MDFDNPYETQIDGPSAVEVDRLVRLKAEQEKALNAISNRIRHLQAAERKVWKEITDVRNGCLKRQEAQLRHQSDEVEMMQRGQGEQRRRAELIRACASERALHQQRRQVALQATRERKAQMGREGREESNRLQRLLERGSEQRKLEAASRAEEHRREKAQVKIRRQVDNTEKGREKKFRNAARSNELEETLAQVVGRIQQAEQEEMACITRLQNSQAVRDSLMDEIRTTNPPPMPTPQRASASASVSVSSKGVSRGQSMPDIAPDSIPGTPKIRSRGVAPSSPPSRIRRINSARPAEGRSGGSPTLSPSAQCGSLSARSIRSTPTPCAPRSTSARSRSVQGLKSGSPRSWDPSVNGGFDELVNIQTQLTQLQRRYDSKLRQVQKITSNKTGQQGPKISASKGRPTISKAPTSPQFTLPLRTIAKGRGQPLSGEASTAVSSEDADEFVYM